MININEGSSRSKEAHQTTVELNRINVTLVDVIGYLHHKRGRPNEVSTWNVRAFKGKSKHDIRLNWN